MYHEVIAKLSIEKLLEPSNTKIAEIEEYLEQNQVLYVSAKEQRSEQTFTIKDKQYILKEKEILEEIYLKIITLCNYSVVQQAVNRRPKILKIEELLEANYQSFNNYILDSINKELVSPLVIKALSSMVIAAIQKNAKAFIFPTNSTARNLGSLIIEAFLKTKILYADYEDPDLKKRFNENNKKTKVKEYKKRSKSNLQEYLAALKNKEDPSLAKKIIPIDLDEPTKTLIIALLSVELMDENLDIDKRDFHQYNELILKSNLSIGCILMGWLYEIKLFKEIEGPKGVPHVLLSQDHVIDLTANATFYKPTISPEDTSTLHEGTLADNIELLLDINKKITPNNQDPTKHTKIKLTAKIKELIESYTKTKMCIAKGQLENFIEILKALNSDYTASEDEEYVNAYIKAVYDLDIKEMVDRNINDKESYATLKEIREFGRKFHQFQDKELAKRCATHIGATRAYNIISSYKFIICGLINDLNIYQHFNYFYIPKYMASTGRVFSKPFFLQLQGIKLVRAFIIFKNNMQLTEEKIRLIDQIFTKHLEESAPGVPRLLKPIKSLEDHLNEVRSFITDQIYSLGIPEIRQNIKNYSLNNTTREQLLWLTKHVKKNKDILYVRTLIHGILENDYCGLIYEKDATSSGLQIISMLIRDMKLGEQTNVVGTEAHDIYSEFVDCFKEDYSVITNTLEKFAKEVIELPYEEFITLIDKPKQPKDIKYHICNLLRYESTKSNEKNFEGINDFDDTYFIKITNELKKEFPKKFAAIQTFQIPINKLVNVLTNRVYVSAKQLKKEQNIFGVLKRLKLFVAVERYFINIPLDLISRKLVKRPVMAVGYSQDHKSRKVTLDNEIQDYFMTRGYARVSLDTTLLIEILAHYFKSYISTHLKGIKKFLYLVGIFTKNVKEFKEPNITISLSYLTWFISEYHHRESRYTFFIPLSKSNRSIPHKFTIYHDYD